MRVEQLTPGPFVRGLVSGPAVRIVQADRTEEPSLQLARAGRAWAFDKRPVFQFEDVVRPMVDQTIVLERKNANLRTQRDLLLPKVIFGELGVSEAPGAEEVAA